MPDDKVGGRGSARRTFRAISSPRRLSPTNTAARRRLQSAWSAAKQNSPWCSAGITGKGVAVRRPLGSARLFRLFLDATPPLFSSDVFPPSPPAGTAARSSVPPARSVGLTCWKILPSASASSVTRRLPRTAAAYQHRCDTHAKAARPPPCAVLAPGSFFCFLCAGREMYCGEGCAERRRRREELVAVRPCTKDKAACKNCASCLSPVRVLTEGLACS